MTEPPIGGIKLDPAPERPLPMLREDIRLFRGPDEIDGSPTYNLYDPVRAQFFQITWAESLLLQNMQPGLTLSQLTEKVNHQTTLQVSSKEIEAFFIEASRNNLLGSTRSSEDILKEAELKKSNPIVWLIFHYLYIRLPLLNPDAFLGRTLKYVLPLVSKPALAFYLTLTILGLLQLINRFDEFLSTFTYFFSFEGAIFYAGTISLVKIVHEFSHAYVAKYYRLHIPTMGIVFMVLWPVLYTDVTDGWKLSKRRQRLAISFAGIAAELIIAGMSTFGWAVSSPGVMQSAFFIIASATWISTLLININPAMRFDGYYLLCDLWGIDNLQFRAFAYTRWQLRKWLLGLDIPPPEDRVSFGRKIGFIVYTIYTWLYRIILYITIAIFVYYAFIKTLGIILFAVEVGVFIFLPFYWEGKELKTLYPFMTINRRMITTLAVIGTLLLWYILPWPHMETFPAITVPSHSQTVYVPYNGVVSQIHVKLNDHVKVGQHLLNLVSKPLDLAIADKEAEQVVIQNQINILSLSDEERVYLPEKTAELSEITIKLAALIEKRKELAIDSTLTGLVYAWDETIRVGQFVAKDRVIGKIADLNTLKVFCYVSENNLLDVELGKEVIFRLKNHFTDIPGKISRISYVRVLNLDEHPQLASINGGELPVSDVSQNELKLVESFYLVEVEVDKNRQPLVFGETGHILMRGPWNSKLMKTLRYFHSIFWRESGF